MSRALISFLVLPVVLTVGCDPSTTVVADAEGRFEMTLEGEPLTTRTDGRKHLWDLGAVVVTVQRIERTPYNEDTPLTEIASALVTRFDEGDVEGSLTHIPCELAGRPARCTRGHVIHEDRRTERRGALVEDGSDEIVWIEILSAPADDEHARRQIDRIEKTLRWTS